MCDYPSVYSVRTRVARKEHRCVECCGTIAKGETYHLFSGCWEGRWSDYKTCPDCQQLRADIDAVIDHDEDRPAFGELYQWVFDSSENAPLIRRFMAIRRKRNAPLSTNGWMEQHLTELNAGKLAGTNQ